MECNRITAVANMAVDSRLTGYNWNIKITHNVHKLGLDPGKYPAS